MKYVEKLIFLALCMVCLVGCRGDSPDKETEKELSKEELTKEAQTSAKLKEMAALYQEIYEQFYQEDLLGTIEMKEEIANCLGDAGYVVSDTENEINMLNSEQAESFCEAAQSGKRADVMIFLVMDNGGLVCYDLQTTDGKMDVVVSSLLWERTEAKTDYYEEFTAYSWSYTEKGYLFIEQYRPQGYDGAPGQIGIRIKPLDRKLRELNQKYVMPVGYKRNQLLTSDWSEDDYSELDFYDLYEILYEFKYGESVPYDSDIGGREYEIPKQDFEEVIQSYLNVDSSILEERAMYHVERQTYCYRPRGMYDAEMPYGPYPEVVAYEEQADGTLILTVEVVWIRKNLDCAITSELVIRPLDDGTFRYVSNQLIPSKSSIEPEWYQPRLTDDEWNDLYGDEADAYEKGYDLPIAAEDRENAVADCENVMKIIRDIYIAADKGNAGNVVISEETAVQMLEAIKETECTSFFGHSFVNMYYYEKLEDFLMNAANGKVGGIVVYEVISTGGISRKEFQFDGKDMYVLNCTATWNKMNEPAITDISYTKIKEWKYTEKGWLSYSLCVPEYPEVTEVMDGSRLIRVRPISAENREMTEKCVSAIGYQGNNLFCSDWDAVHMEQLDYNGLYEYLYKLKYEKSFPFENYPNGIPQKEFESLIMEYLPIKSEQIKQYAVFDEENQTYAWADLSCFNYDPSFFGTAIPEVTEIRENKDGTITLSVDAVCEKILCDDAVITHELTVRFREDGSFQYLGNEILDNGAEIVPEYRYRVMDD